MWITTKKTTKSKKETLVKKKPLIKKATAKEISEFMERYSIKLSSLSTYNKCYFKDWIVVCNKLINLLLKDPKTNMVYSATNWNKVDSSLEFIWAVQNIQHPEPIVFII